jgi:hypothetical protein
MNGIFSSASLRRPWWLNALFLILMLLCSEGNVSANETMTRGQELNKRVEATLKALPSDGIQKATFYPGRDDSGNFLSTVKTKNINYRPEFTLKERRKLAGFLKTLKPTKDIGMQGPWDRFGDINVDAGASGHLRIILTTRKSLGGRVLASVQIVGEILTYSLYFDAADMWTWLIER